MASKMNTFGPVACTGPLHICNGFPLSVFTGSLSVWMSRSLFLVYLLGLVSFSCFVQFRCVNFFILFCYYPLKNLLAFWWETEMKWTQIRGEERETGVEEKETVIRIYYVRGKSLFSIKGKKHTWHQVSTKFPW